MSEEEGDNNNQDGEEEEEEEEEDGSNLRRVNTDDMDEIEVRDSYVFRESDAEFRDTTFSGPPRDSDLEYRDTDIIDRESRSFKKKEKPKPTFCHVISMTCCVCGVSFAWVLYLISIRGFMSDMGVDDNIVRWWTFLVPPFVNMIAQLIIGCISDCCYVPFFGRRKVYLTMGVLFVLSSFFLSSHSDWIGIYIFSFFPGSEILFLFLTFPFVIFSLGCCFLLMRALIADIVPPDLQVFSNASYNFFYSVGFLLAIIVSIIPFPVFIPLYSYSFKVYFYITFFVLCFPFCCCICCIKERPYDIIHGIHTSRLSFAEVEPLVRNDNNNNNQSSDDDDDEYEGEIEFPPKMPLPLRFRKSLKQAAEIRYTFWLTILIQFFSFFGRQTLLFFAIDFFEYQIIEPNMDGYIWGYLSLISYFLFSAVVSPIIPGLNIILPSKYIWFCLSIIQVIGMSSFPFIYNSYVACAVFSALGIVEASINTLPWSVMMETISNSDEFQRRGFFIGMFNLSQCVAVFFVASFGYSFRLLFTQVLHFPFGVVLSLLSVIPAIIATILILFIKEPKQKRWITCSELCRWFIVSPILKVVGRVSWDGLEDLDN